MNARFACLGLIGALMPVAVEVPVDSSGGYAGVTRVHVAGGGGSYAFVARGCEGEVIDTVPARFEDVGVSLEHRIGEGPLVLGVRGGRVRHRIGMPEDTSRFQGVPVDAVVDNAYVNPYASIERPEGGFGVGWVFHRNEFITAGEHAREQLDHPMNDLSAHLRVGYPRANHFDIQWMEGVPLASSGGYFTALLGGPLRDDPHWIMHGGLGAGGPYEGAGLALRIEHLDDSGLSLDVSTRLGHSGNRAQWGAALGVSYTVRP